jgi:hypothetical protein
MKLIGDTPYLMHVSYWTPPHVHPSCRLHPEASQDLAAALVGSATYTLLVFLSHRIICKCTDANCSLHQEVFQGINSTGKQ